MKGNRKPKLIAGAIAGLAVAGGGAAFAATQLGSPQQENQAVLKDAAKQLGVQPSALSAALKKALENRVDAAVAAGTLTNAQGAELKQRIESGDVPLFGGPGPGFHHGGRFGGLDAAASYLGLTEAQLRTQLESGKTFDATMIFFLAALFTFAFARELECSEEASVIAATAFAMEQAAASGATLKLLFADGRSVMTLCLWFALGFAFATHFFLSQWLTTLLTPEIGFANAARTQAEFVLDLGDNVAWAGSREYPQTDPADAFAAYACYRRQIGPLGDDRQEADFRSRTG